MESVHAPLYSAVSFFYYHLVETVIFGALIFFFFLRRRKPKVQQQHLTEEQEDKIIAKWLPEPLVPKISSIHTIFNPRIANGKIEKYANVDGKRCLNLATSNYLGFVGDKRIEEVAKLTISKYGVGSCGPRSFYGTVDVHLELEKQLAAFMGCEDAVLYSYGFATIASSIPAYAKRDDIIYVDKGVNFAIQTGIQASRSKIEWFEHNDMDELEALLKAQNEKDKKNPKAAAKVRRFIIVEGLYSKTADLCPLDKIIELKWRYKVRVFIDESLSFGVIGNTGRGVTEHFNIDVVSVDMIMVSLENAVASTGGFCCGRTFVMEHQRLSGLGYCFSASLPPLLTTAAGEAVKIMNAEPDRFVRLRDNAERMHSALVDACAGTAYVIQGVEISPLKHVMHHDNDEAKLDAMVEKLFDAGVLVTRARYLTTNEKFAPRPSVKVTCSSEMTSVELDSAISEIHSVLTALS